MIKIKECTRKNWCKDCYDKECTRAGEKEADCPKWVCDRDGDCDRCSFLKSLYTEETNNRDPQNKR